MLTKARSTIFTDKKVLVVGLARSGIGAANLLCSCGAQVSVTDIKSRDYLKDNIKKLFPSIKVIAGEYPEELFDTADIIVVSPGVLLDIPPLKRAREKGIPIIGELELAYQAAESMVRIGDSANGGESTQDPHHVKPHFISITGTNGKSTVTTLIDMMLKKAHFRTIMGGNIGSALTEEMNQLKVADEELKIDYVVAEVSSFQLESIQYFRPAVSLILNITSDHLNRHSSMQEYVNAKANIFKNQGSGDCLILNADDPEVMKLYNSRLKLHNSNLRKINTLFCSRKNEVQGIYYKDGVLFFNFFSSLLSTPGTTPSGFLRKGFVPPFSLVAVDEIKMKGVHNLENVMASSLAAFICGCTVEKIRDVLKEFPGLEHRLEFVCEIGGIKFINDSKGTNVGAVVKSLESFQNVILIMGGRDKDGDFNVLKNLVKQKVKSLILLGEAQKKIADAIGEITETVFVKDIREAVKLSLSKAVAGDVVLLSPGCASFDMFANFEERGKRFKEAVREILNS
ncbi:MAG: UDP-N-acetylmuramoyl-L-alanine--D-glutamate ligase [Thermodesulfovibrionia bacterium]|nr:UDP-N-acetylmuramoyl-L-alanine--D-glutamate ligase [Thermodesulfovibrionia bacterium]